MNDSPLDRYGRDVLAASSPAAHRRRPVPEVPAERGLVVEDAETGWCGAVTEVEKGPGAHLVVLEDGRGRTRSFALGPGFLLEGRPVRLTRPAPRRRTVGTGRSASGSTVVRDVRARVASGSRIWVEGRHDAELVEKIWGHDLRVEGVVVEMLDGADNLPELVARFRPTPERKLGILLDHLVAGSKESRIAEQVLRSPAARDCVHIVGHPFVDIWQAIRPAAVGIRQWPHVPRGTDIKAGTLTALGMPADSPADIAEGWRFFLSTVNTFGDLEPALLGRVEELIDFVTG